MSKLNINRNIFLEREELIRFQEFLGRMSVVNQSVLENTTNWGIVRTVFEGDFPDFKIEAGTNSGTIKIANLSKAVDSSKNLIYQEPIDNIPVTNDGNWYWVKISHTYSNLEKGTCSINALGELVGVDTKFLEVLRGQSTEVPVKIKFYKQGGAVNNQVYEVVDSPSDTSALLTGGSFSVESGLNYIVIGSTPIGDILTAQQLEGLYFYDSCLIELIAEQILDTPPTSNFVQDLQFYLARVKNVANVLTIQDKREEFLTFNVEGVSDKLDKAKNLSDLTDKAQARANLGVSTSAEIEAAFFQDTGWVNMTRGLNVDSAGFDMKIRRMGKNICITGKFKLNGNLVQNELLFSAPLSSLGGESAIPAFKIYHQCMVIETDQNNHGFQMYIDPSDTNYLAIKASTGLYVPSGTWDFEYNVTINYLSK